MTSSANARRVCWALARECRPDDVLVVGVATPLAAAAAFVARELLTPDLTVIAGGAVDPPIVDIADFLTDARAIARAAPGVLGQGDLLDLVQRGAITLQFVSPAQVDAAGAVNTSRVRTGSGWRRLPGCLAIPDTAALVGRLVAYRVEGGDRFVVDRVDHVTGLGRDDPVRARWSLSGRGVVAVVTEAGRWDLDHRGGQAGGWTSLDVPPPEFDELLDRVLDPRGVIGLETQSDRAAARLALARSVVS